MEDFMIKTWTDTKTELDAYFDRLADELHDRIESGEVSEPSLTPPEIIHHAYMLTQYQYGGGYSVSYDDYARYVQREVMGDPTVEQVNAHLDNDCFEPFYSNDPITFKDAMCGLDAWTIATKTRFDWNPNDPYFRFEGDDNISSYEEWQIIKDYKEETNKYLFETSNYSGCENKDELEALDDDYELVIEYCNRMLRDGF